MSGPELGRAAGLLCRQNVGAPTGERWGGLGLRSGQFPRALPPQSLPRPLAWLEQGRGRPSGSSRSYVSGAKKTKAGEHQEQKKSLATSVPRSARIDSGPA